MRDLLRTGMLLMVLATAPARAIENPGLQEWIDQQIAGGGDLAITAMHLADGQAAYFAGGTITSGKMIAPDRDTRFQLGSITKPFTNLLLAELVAAGKVEYATTLGDLMSVTPANAAVADITLLELATHTSGLPRLPPNLVPANPLDPYKGYDATLLVRAVTAVREQQPLGKHYAYSNFGVGLLGHLLGEVHGDGFHAAMRARVLDPLGLEETGFEESANLAQGFRNGTVVPAWSMDDALAGAGALWGSVSDLAILARAYLDATGSGGPDNPLRHDLRRDLEVIATADRGFAVTRVWHVARAGAAPIYWHNGGTGGYWSFFGFRPDRNQAVAVLVAGATDPTAHGLSLLGRTPPEPVADKIDPAVLGQYTLSPAFGIGVYERDGILMGQASGQPPFPLRPLGEDWYALSAVDASVRFQREGDRVTGMQLAQNGRLQTLEKTADAAAAAGREAIELDPGQLAAYEGRYALAPGATFIIRRAGDTLEAQLTGQPFLPIYPRGDDVFFYRAVDAELHFQRNEAGEIEALVLHQGALVQRAEKID